MKAIESEIDSLYNNEIPSGRKAISSKWVFKRKYDADGNLEQHIARLIAQGFVQKHGVDYDETFSPVVMFESVQTVIALAAKHVLKQQEGFDIKDKKIPCQVPFLKSLV